MIYSDRYVNELMSEPVTILVEKCPRCGGSHGLMKFHALDRPAGDTTHWVSCVITQQPILLEKPKLK